MFTFIKVIVQRIVISFQKDTSGLRIETPKLEHLKREPLSSSNFSMHFCNCFLSLLIKVQMLQGYAAMHLQEGHTFF